MAEIFAAASLLMMMMMMGTTTTTSRATMPLGNGTGKGKGKGKGNGSVTSLARLQLLLDMCTWLTCISIRHAERVAKKQEEMPKNTKIVPAP